MKQLSLINGALLSALLLVGCIESTSSTTTGLAQPIGFAYACEGDDHTVPPALDERPETEADYDRAQLCPDVLVGGSLVRGMAIGVVLNQHPPGATIVQMDPASGAGALALDADLFVPGITPVPVGAGPTHVVRSPDWTSFYVLSAGTREVTQLVVAGVQAEGRVGVSRATISLPAAPGELLATEAGLLVSAADRPELWIVPLALEDAKEEDLRIIQLPDTIQEMGTLEGDLVVTWRGRPALSRWEDALGALEAEDGSAPAWEETGLIGSCEDGFDDDGDGLADALDPSCQGPRDRESSAGERSAQDGPAPAADEASASCEDGIDNDGDGLADALDHTCQGDNPTELVGPCNDGLDNDGDGLVDAGDDPGCYGPNDGSEADPRPWGPARLAIVGRSANGHAFAYVHLESRQELAVVSLPSDGGVERIQVPAYAVEVPALSHIPYSAMPDGDTESLPGYRVASRPGLVESDTWNLTTSSLVGGRLQAGPLRGELWKRLVSPEVDEERPSVALGLSAGTESLPLGCDPEVTERCQQPAGDGDSWYVYLPRLDGHVDLVEVVRRGTPVHRLAQSTNAPEERDVSLAGRPVLHADGVSVFVGSTPPTGLPLIGPMTALEEIEEAEEGVSPARLRSYGIWSPEDPELVPSETWSLTYEGTLPDTTGHLGEVVGPHRFVASGRNFCEAGVVGDAAEGDLLVLTGSAELVDETLLPTAWELRTVDGTDAPCPVKTPPEALISFRIQEVGAHQLEVVPDSARLRRTLPVLDEDAIQEAGTAVVSCQEALDAALELSATGEGPFPWSDPAPADLNLEDLPGRWAYEVRPEGHWTVVGSLSGFLHAQRWTPDEDDAEDTALGGTCAATEDSAALTIGRARTATLASGYQTCPPSNAELSHDSVDALLTSAEDRFANHSFQVDILPGCSSGSAGEVELVAPRRGTRWTFSLDGPDAPRTIFISNPLAPPALGLLDTRRQLVHMDTNLGRMVVLELQPDSVSPMFSVF